MPLANVAPASETFHAPACRAGPGLLMLLCLLGGAASAGVSTSSDGLLEALTLHRWQRSVDQGEEFAPERFSWDFHHDGRYRRAIHNDTSQVESGSWRLVATRDGSGGVLLLCDGDGVAVGLYAVTLTGDRLQLAGHWYEPADAGTDARHRGATPGQEPAPAAVDNALWRALTTQHWALASEAGPVDPDVYVFSPNGEFSANYRHSGCEVTGDFSLLALQPHAATLRLNLANDCLHTGATLREFPVRLTDEQELSVYRTRYRGIQETPLSAATGMHRNHENAPREEKGK